MVPEFLKNSWKYSWISWNSWVPDKERAPCPSLHITEKVPGYLNVPEFCNKKLQKLQNFCKISWDNYSSEKVPWEGSCIPEMSLKSFIGSFKKEYFVPGLQSSWKKFQGLLKSSGFLDSSQRTKHTQKIRTDNYWANEWVPKLSHCQKSANVRIRPSLSNLPARQVTL